MAMVDLETMLISSVPHHHAKINIDLIFNAAIL